MRLLLIGIVSVFVGTWAADEATIKWKEHQRLQDAKGFCKLEIVASYNGFNCAYLLERYNIKTYAEEYVELGFTNLNLP